MEEVLLVHIALQKEQVYIRCYSLDLNFCLPNPITNSKLQTSFSTYFLQVTEHLTNHLQPSQIGRLWLDEAGGHSPYKVFVH